MGNSLDAYRAAIGLLYTGTHRRIKLSGNLFHLNLKFQFYCIINILFLLSLTTCIKRDQYAFCKFILLIIYMDMELNPGPITSDRSLNTLGIFHLNTRSIRNKSNSICNIAEQYHILCFCETHLDPNFPTSNSILDEFNHPERKD